MPTLPENVRSDVENAEGGDFEALPEGKYIASLMEVEAREGKKAPYWSWTFEVQEPEEHKGRRLWMNTSLSKAAAWKMKEVFDAFGVPVDTDTDEICGNLVTLTVGRKIIDGGKRAGEIGNEIERVSPGPDAPDTADEDDSVF